MEKSAGPDNIAEIIKDPFHFKSSIVTFKKNVPSILATVPFKKHFSGKCTLEKLRSNGIKKHFSNISSVIRKEIPIFRRFVHISGFS